MLNLETLPFDVSDFRGMEDSVCDKLRWLPNRFPNHVRHLLLSTLLAWPPFVPVFLPPDSKDVLFAILRPCMIPTFRHYYGVRPITLLFRRQVLRGLIEWWLSDVSAADYVERAVLFQRLQDQARQIRSYERTH